MPVLDLQGRHITYREVKGSSRRYVYFKFRPDLTLDVLLPKRGEVDINEVIKKKQDWILKKYDELSKNVKILDDGKLMFKGRYLNLVVNRTEDTRIRQPEIHQDEIIFYSSGQTEVKEMIRQYG